jgi:hypothetical protein
MKKTAHVDSEFPSGTETPSRSGQNSREDVEHLVRSFNTALISTRAETQVAGSRSDELHRLVNSPAFREILEASRRLSASQGLSAQAAAESLIRTFRAVDQIWSDYVFSEGIARLREQPSAPGKP